MILSKPNHIKIYGHRGARGDLPENTLESFKYLFDNNINVSYAEISAESGHDAFLMSDPHYHGILTTYFKKIANQL